MFAMYQYSYSFTWKLFTCRNEQYLPDASSNLKTGERDNALSAFLEYTVSSIFMVSFNAVEIEKWSSKQAYESTRKFPARARTTNGREV